MAASLTAHGMMKRRDPGDRCANWIDLKGHREGTLVFRWSRSKDPVPPIETELVKWSEL